MVPSHFDKKARRTPGEKARKSERIFVSQASEQWQGVAIKGFNLKCPWGPRLQGIKCKKGGDSPVSMLDASEVDPTIHFLSSTVTSKLRNFSNVESDELDARLGGDLDNRPSSST